MSSRATSADAWPFVLGRGRAVGYRILALPSFMDEDLDSQLFADLHTDLSPEEPFIHSTPWRDGQLTAVYCNSQLYRSELDDPLTGSWRQAHQAETTSPEDKPKKDRVAEDQPIKDEHGRPIAVIYGFLTTRPSIDTLDTSDMATSRREALAVYQDLLGNDETEYSTSRTSAFSSRSAFSPIPQSSSQPDDEQLHPWTKHPLAWLTAASAFVGLGTLVALFFALKADVPAPCCEDPIAVDVVGPLLVAASDTAQEGELGDLSVELDTAPLCLYVQDHDTGAKSPIVWPRDSLWLPDGETVAVGGKDLYPLPGISDLPALTVNLSSLKAIDEAALEQHLTACFPRDTDQAVVVLQP